MIIAAAVAALLFAVARAEDTANLLGAKSSNAGEKLLTAYSFFI